jgi:hypothetical protein
VFQELLYQYEDILLVYPLFFKTKSTDYYANPLKRGYLSSPAVDLSELGLAPPKIKPKAPLPTVPITQLLTRSHAVLMATAQKEKIRREYHAAKRRYEHELALAEQYGYIDGKNRIPKRLRIKN